MIYTKIHINTNIIGIAAELEKPTSIPINCMSHIQIHTFANLKFLFHERHNFKIMKKKRTFQILRGNVIRISAHENINKQDESDTYIIDSEMQTNKKNSTQYDFK